MRHRVLIKDYGFNEYTAAEGWGEIVVDGIELRVFITGMKLPHILYKDDYRGKEIDVEIAILEHDVMTVGIRKKMILYLSEKDALVPHYLFIGEVVEKKDEKKCGKVIFDCGILLDACMDKGYSFKELKKGDYILVIGRLDMLGVDDLR